MCAKVGACGRAPGLASGSNERVEKLETLLLGGKKKMLVIVNAKCSFDMGSDVRMVKALKKIGFEQNQSEPCSLTKKSEKGMRT